MVGIIRSRLVYHLSLHAGLLCKSFHDFTCCRDANLWLDAVCIGGPTGGHLALSGGLWNGRTKLRTLSRLFVEFCGQFSEELACAIHIKRHHPYTNIVRTGHTRPRKAPFLPRYFYMFVTPWVMPLLGPVVSVTGLVQKRNLSQLLLYLIFGGAGLATAIVFLMKISDFPS